MPDVRRSSVPDRVNYVDYREDLRVDFWFSCAYCSITEQEAAGIGFEIDHYLAKAKYPAISCEFLNLLWSCRPCNRAKDGLVPSPVHCSEGYRFFRPDCDNWGEHFVAQGALLQWRTKTGEYSVEVLRLNRQQLLRLREARRKFWGAGEAVARGLIALRGFPIDRLPKRARAHVLHLIKVLADEDGRILDAAIRATSRSELLDSEPDRGTRMAQRRAFLQRIGAIGLE